MRQWRARGAADALPLRTVSRLTGLSPDVIRAWERRYAVVQPVRGPRGARLYGAADVQRLRLLRHAVTTGRAIGDVARLAPRELEALGALPAAVTPAAEVGPAGAPVVARALAALQRFDAPALDRVLGDALLALGSRALIAQVVEPLLGEVGERWSDGRLSVADEHLLSGVLRGLLAGLLRGRAGSAGPTVLLATPAGERHELGLLLAGLVVADAGVGLCYLGPDLPAADIATAAQRAGVAVVGLGLVNGANARAAAAEVRRIERALPAATEVWLGGRGAAGVAARLGATRAIVLDQVPALDDELRRLRTVDAPRPQ